MLFFATYAVREYQAWSTLFAAIVPATCATSTRHAYAPGSAAPHPVGFIFLARVDGVDGENLLVSYSRCLSSARTRHACIGHRPGPLQLRLQAEQA